MSDLLERGVAPTRRGAIGAGGRGPPRRRTGARTADASGSADPAGAGRRAGGGLEVPGHGGSRRDRAAEDVEREAVLARAQVRERGDAPLPAHVALSRVPRGRGTVGA